MKRLAIQPVTASVCFEKNIGWLRAAARGNIYYFYGFVKSLLVFLSETNQLGLAHSLFLLLLLSFACFVPAKQCSFMTSQNASIANVTQCS